jgi:protein O-mannosyl-transferase
MIRQQAPLPAASGATTGDDRRRIAGVCVVLAAITFAVFAQTLRHEFINFDDNDYVYDNPVVARGLTLKGIAWAFSCHLDNWHPLTWLSHMLDCQLYGLRPGGHHLTNVLLHIATVILLFLVLRRMTGSLWRSAFVAAVFAIHPLRVESVAWVAERKDVLSGLFFMLTVGAYVRYTEELKGERSRFKVFYALALVFFILGLMSKPMLVTVPLVLLLLDYWPLRRETPLGRLLVEKLPFLALSAACCLTTLFAQQEAMQTIETISLPLRCANALVTGMVYLAQMIWPAGLAVYYPYPFGGLPSWEVALAAMLLAGLSAVAWWQRRQQPWIWIGWLWYLVMLLPVLGIIQVGAKAHADRYTYLPQIGIYVAVTWLAAEWGAKLHLGRVAMGSFMAAVLGTLIICAWKQTAYWKSSETLWTHTLECTTRNDIAHNNLGAVLRNMGRVDEAIPHFQDALKISPGYAEARFNLGTAFAQKGGLDQAINQYRFGLRSMPGDADAHVNLATVYLQKGDLDEAIGQYQIALQINPGDAARHIALGSLLLQRGRMDEAIAHFQKSLQIKPDDANAQNNLGSVYLQLGRMDDAMVHFQHALQIDPDYAEVHNNLGLVFLKKGELDQAHAQFERALQLGPHNPQVLKTVAWVLATCPEASARNGGKAVQLAQQANDLAGGKNPAMLRTLAAAFAEARRFGDAVRTAQEAMALARAAGQQDLALRLEAESKRYEAGFPLHQ